MESNIARHVKNAFAGMVKQSGKDVLVGAATGITTGYLQAHGKLDYKIGNHNVPLDAVAGIVLLAGSKYLPHTHELPLYGMHAGGDLLAIAAHRQSQAFFAAKAGVHGEDFAPGFGAENDPLLRAAAAL